MLPHTVNINIRTTHEQEALREKKENQNNETKR